MHRAIKLKDITMDQRTEVILFATVSADTHRKLSTIAATLSVPKLELYRQALTWASNQPEFVVDMAKVYKHGRD